MMNCHARDEIATSTPLWEHLCKSCGTSAWSPLGAPSYRYEDWCGTCQRETWWYVSPLPAEGSKRTRPAQEK
jgi:hypothetical protein